MLSTFSRVTAAPIGSDLCSALLCCLIAASIPPAHAQSSYPNRPVKIIAPQAPGGGVDLVGRIIAERHHGEVALVTGAGRNIGRAIALSLAAEGAIVAVNARSNAAELDAVVAAIEAAGGRAFAVLADVADAAAVQRMVAAVIERCGRLDILVNNAAVRRESPLEATTHDAWRVVIATVLDGEFLCTQACVPHLRNGGTGTIGNIGGLTGHSSACMS